MKVTVIRDEIINGTLDLNRFTAMICKLERANDAAEKIYIDAIDIANLDRALSEIRKSRGLS